MSARLAFVLAAVVLVSAAASERAVARDAEYQRLSDSFAALSADPKLGTLAPVQMDRARAALAALKEGSRGDRLHLVYVAERRIEIARVTAEAVAAESERVTLQQDNNRLQLEAARRVAAQARRELEQQRLQAQIRAEEAERLAREAESARAENEQSTQAAEAARAEAAQARRIADAQGKAAALARREAELASGGTSSAPPKAAPAAKRRMTLADSSFVAGQSTLSDAGSGRIGAAVDFINAVPGSKIHIDATAAGNRSLATARAQTIRDALIEAGIAANRIEAAGSAGKGKGGQVEIRLEEAD
jgi:outer membrane protein OmpA-like peptidoglycan-associated protein